MLEENPEQPVFEAESVNSKDNSREHSRENSISADDRDPVPPRGRRKRTNMTPSQLRILGKVLEHTAFPSRIARGELAKMLNVDQRNIQVWFQNQRQRARTIGKRLMQRDISLSMPDSPTTLLPKFPNVPTVSINPGKVPVGNQFYQQPIPMYYAAIPCPSSHLPGQVTNLTPLMQAVNMQQVPQQIVLMPQNMVQQYYSTPPVGFQQPAQVPTQTPMTPPASNLSSPTLEKANLLRLA